MILLFSTALGAPPAVANFMALIAGALMFGLALAGLLFRVRAAALNRQWREDDPLDFHFAEEPGVRRRKASTNDEDQTRAVTVAARYRNGELLPRGNAPIALVAEEQFFHSEPAEVRPDDVADTGAGGKGILILTNKRLVFAGRFGEIVAPLDQLAAVHWVEDEGIAFRTVASNHMVRCRLEYPCEFMAYVLAILSREGLAVNVREETVAAV